MAQSVVLQDDVVRPSLSVHFDPTVVGPLVDSVIQLGDRNRGTLGFLPFAGFRAAADEGRIAVATNDSGELVAYCLFDLPRDVVRIVHVCVSEAARGQDLARTLIDSVSKRHSDRLGLVLKCRADWPADAMWPRLHFVAQTQVPGRSKTGLPLTVWWRSHGHPDLFTASQDLSDACHVAAIDSNVYSDLHSLKPRKRAADSAALAPFIAAGELSIQLLPTLQEEIYQTNDPRERAVLLEAQVNYRHATNRASESLVQAIVTQIPAAILDRDPSLLRDARLVAEAHSNGIGLFITRDRNAITYLASAASQFDIDMRQPTEVPTYIDLEKANQNYRPAQLAETTYAVKRIDQPLSELEIESLLNKPRGERLPDLRARLANLAARSTSDVRRRVLTDSDGVVRAAWATSQSNLLDVPLLRVRPGPLQSTIAAQLIHLLREEALEANLAVVRATDPAIHSEVAAVLEASGFVVGDAGATALALAEVGSWARVSKAAQDAVEFRGIPGEFRALTADLPREPSSIQASELERIWAPAKILGEGIRNYVIPIRRIFASQLLGYPPSLLARPDDLGLSREHVYYKAPRRQIQFPARALWYASGPTAPAIVATSRLVEETIDRPHKLHRRFARLGVWSLEDVEGASTDGRACALRFTDTEIFASPVSLDRLRALASDGQKLVLRSTRELDDSSFERIYREGMKR